MHKKGFTLIEILAVIVVLGTIMLIVMPRIIGILDDSKKSAFQVEVNSLIDVIQNRMIDNPSLTVSTFTLDYIKNNLGVKTDNYKSVFVSKVNDKVYVEIVGANDWKNYKVYGTINSLNITNDTSTIVYDGLITYFDATNTASYSGTGTAWYDLSGKGLNGTLNNGVIFNGTGIKSMTFDGTNDYVALPATNSIISNNNAFTISAWFNASAIGTYDYSNRIIALMRNSGASTAISLTLGLNNKARLLYADGAATHKYIDSTISLDTWYHMVVTFSGTKYILYLNGDNKAEVTDTFQGFSTGVARIGGMTNDADYFNGKISSVSIYNRALSSTEVLSNYENTKTYYGL